MTPTTSWKELPACPNCGLDREAGFGSNGCERCCFGEEGTLGELVADFVPSEFVAKFRHPEFPNLVRQGNRDMTSPGATDHWEWIVEEPGMANLEECPTAACQGLLIEATEMEAHLPDMDPAQRSAFWCMVANQFLTNCFS